MASKLMFGLTRGFCKHRIYQHSNQSLTEIQGRVLTRHFSGMSDQFNKAKANVSTLKEDPGNEVKLKMYALFKQVRSHCMKCGGEQQQGLHQLAS